MIVESSVEERRKAALLNGERRAVQVEGDGAEEIAAQLDGSAGGLAVDNSDDAD